MDLGFREELVTARALPQPLIGTRARAGRATPLSFPLPVTVAFLDAPKMQFDHDPTSSRHSADDCLPSMSRISTHTAATSLRPTAVSSRVTSRDSHPPSIGALRNGFPLDFRASLAPLEPDRARSLFASDSESDAYSSFFGSIHPPAPPEHARSYDQFFGSSQGSLRPALPIQTAPSALDRILGQPPPPRHALFSNSSTGTFQNYSTGHSSSHMSEIARQLPTFGQFLSSDNFSMDMSFDPPASSQKRKDRASLPIDTPSPQGQTPKRQKPALSTHQKLDQIFNLLKDLDWTLGEALHHIFAHRDSENNQVSRSQRQGAIVETYLSGRSSCTVSGILEAWFTSPYGRHSDQSMFETETPYLSIRPVRQALSAFAAQISADCLQRQSSDAVKKTAGLWAVVGADIDADGNAEWADLGTAIQQANCALRENQHLAMHFLGIIAEPKPRSRKGVLNIRKSRPREHVSDSIFVQILVL